MSTNYDWKKMVAFQTIMMAVLAFWSWLPGSRMAKIASLGVLFVLSGSMLPTIIFLTFWHLPSFELSYSERLVDITGKDHWGHASWCMDWLGVYFWIYWLAGAAFWACLAYVDYRRIKSACREDLRSNERIDPQSHVASAALSRMTLSRYSPWAAMVFFLHSVPFVISFLLGGLRAGAIEAAISFGIVLFFLITPMALTMLLVDVCGFVSSKKGSAWVGHLKNPFKKEDLFAQLSPTQQKNAASVAASLGVSVSDRKFRKAYLRDLSAMEKRAIAQALAMEASTGKPQSDQARPRRL